MTGKEAKELLLTDLNKQIGKIGLAAVLGLQMKVQCFEDCMLAEIARPPGQPQRWIARVQQTPFNFTVPERVVVDAETESDARQTLEASGYTNEFHWHIREIRPEQPAKGRIVTKGIVELSQANQD